MKKLYHNLRKESPESARIVVRQVLENNKYNVSKTAYILGISRKTVRRARDGSLPDCSRRPHTSPNKIRTDLEDLIVNEAKQTGYRYRLLSEFIKNKFSIPLSENTVKAVLKRNLVKPKRVKAKNDNRRRLYDYENLLPFTEFQVDTKHILDQDSLPSSVYSHIIKHNLPKFEWNAIDVKTRTRFTAYSHTLSAEYGFSFLLLVILWCRFHNVRETINIRLDNGSEFCSGSDKKLDEWNDIFSIFNTKLKPIPPGAKYLQAIVENSHRKDDEYFLSIHPERCFDDKSFIYKCQQWQDTWNTARPNFGIDMFGMTPAQKLSSLKPLISKNIYSFPVLLLDSFLRKVDYAMNWFYKYLGIHLFTRGGNYVYATCRKLFIFTEFHMSVT